jgi:hypothetical protein
MAHIKVSITRKYYGKIPVDKTGKPIPKKLWPRRRSFSWQDIDFEKKTVAFTSKQASDIILPWEPKDHENRVIPIPEKMIRLFADLQAQSEDGNLMFLSGP